MKISITAVIITLLAIGVAFAIPVTPVTSVLNGTIDVGTFVSAEHGQYETQTSIGTVSGSSVITNVSSTPVISSTIVGTASSVASGTGIVFPSFNVNGYSSSAIVQGNIHTTIVDYPIPVTTITPHSSH
jgi:hypothetical protein